MMYDLPNLPEADDVAELSAGYLDGTLSEEETRRLSERLGSDVEARRVFVALAMQSHWLSETFSQRLGASGIMMQCDEPALEPMILRRRTGWAAAAMLLIAAAVAVTVMWNTRPASTTTAAYTDDVALLSDMSPDARWAPTQMPTQLGANLPAGTLSLVAGKAQVMFHSGAVVDMIGPCKLTMTEPNRGILRSGSVMATVPPRARGFMLDTPNMRIVDMGTQFVAIVDDEGKSQVHVISGTVMATAMHHDQPMGEPIKLIRGQGAMRTVGDDGALQRVTSNMAALWPTDQPYGGPIHLGNLFDDPKDATLAAAMTSDTFAAIASDHSLGVWRVVQGGDPIESLAGRVRFDLGPLGWSGDKYGAVVNDAWTPLNDMSKDPAGGIRTVGDQRLNVLGICEQGVGMHANAMIVFDLDAIRKAGRLDGRSLRFISERAGINDDALGTGARARTAVIVADDRGVEAAYVNGKACDVKRGDDGVWRCVNPDRSAVSTDGHFVRFDVPLPPRAKYLALVATGATDIDGSIGFDHVVFSNARLESK